MPLYPTWSRLIHKSEIDILPTRRGLIKFYWATVDYDTLQYISSSINIRRRAYQMEYEGWWNYIRFSETPGFSRRELLVKKRRLIDYNDPPYNW